MKESIVRWIFKCILCYLRLELNIFITGVILFYFGTGPIRGFATTLIIGILGLHSLQQYS
jgi:SecD/SecF fusion protein